MCRGPSHMVQASTFAKFATQMWNSAFYEYNLIGNIIVTGCFYICFNLIYFLCIFKLLKWQFSFFPWAYIAHTESGEQ